MNRITGEKDAPGHQGCQRQQFENSEDVLRDAAGSHTEVIDTGQCHQQTRSEWPDKTSR